MSIELSNPAAAEATRVPMLRRVAAAAGAVLLPFTGVACAPEAPTAAPAAMSEETFATVMQINATQVPGDAALLRLRNCESTNNYQAVNKSGKYMGAYQFNQGTWNGVVDRAGLDEFVGVKPNKAPAGVQDAATRHLYSERGRAPWPVCGKRI